MTYLGRGSLLGSLFCSGVAMEGFGLRLCLFLHVRGLGASSRVGHVEDCFDEIGGI
jgi:hypothetical protein